MRFLKIGDRAAGAIKSRRHHAPRREDGLPRPRPPRHRGLRQLEGRSRSRRSPRSSRAARCSNEHLNAVLKACHATAPDAEDARFDRAKNADAARGHRRGAPRSRCPMNYIAARDRAREAGLHARSRSRSTTPTGTARRTCTVSGQNSQQLGPRHRTTSCSAVDADGDVEARRAAPTSKVAQDASRPATLWDKIAYAAWACADPGVQFDTTINEWHTCPADGRINASATRAPSTCSSTTRRATSRR